MSTQHRKLTTPGKQARQVNFRLPVDTEEALQRIKVRDGIPISEQVRRALLLWLAQNGMAPTKGKR